MEQETEVAALVPAIKENADALGLRWQLRPATTIFNSNGIASVRFDGDGEVNARTVPLIADIVPGDRVMVMIVPPGQNYIIGYANADRPNTLISRCTTLTPNSSNVTFATPTGMTPVPLRAGFAYDVEIWVLHTTDLATTGISLRIDFSGVVGEGQFIGMIQATNTSTWIRAAPQINSDVLWAASASVANGSVDFVSGYIVPSTDGELSLQFRSEVNGENVYISPISHIRVRKTVLI